MQASQAIAAAPAKGRALPGWAVPAALLLLCSLFMFVDARVPPIYLWDESRLAVNALEMYHSGWSLVTTYGFAPDLWNTKPPLMIWLMNASIWLFGPSEVALRVPSMVGALGTLLVVYAFVGRVTHSTVAAAFAVFLLSTSVAFFGRHGARAADFDALLVFFTTSYLALLFFAVHRRRPSTRLLILIGALVAAAALTKTIAAFVPGAGVAVYLLLTRRLGRALRDPRYVLMVVAAALPLLLFYVARELAAPGYLAAVWFNDFAGRYQAQLGPMQRSPWFYFQELADDWMFSAGPLAMLAPLGLLGRKGRSRQALVFALCCVVTQIVLISLPETRLIQYMAPALPWLAIACAIAMADRLPRFVGSDKGALLNPANALLAITVLCACVTAGRLRYELLPQQDYYPEASYGSLFTTLHDRGVRQVTVVEPGFDVSGIRAYAPQFDFYALLWSRRDMNIARVERRGQLVGGGLAVSCNSEAAKDLVAVGAEPVGFDGCVAVRLSGRAAI
ncbi:MAG TPA: glycosyltransferase family 39 protein [Sphingomicrobium sp.]|jgi:4-amino-4-deoxy-L-arabinose transferase-like glycosyltransferase